MSRLLLQIVTLLLLTNHSMAQQNWLPLNSFYKDQLLSNKLSEPYNQGSFYPVNEADYNLMPKIIDSTKRYYDATYILYQKHLFEINAKDVYITISAAANISYGKDFGDTTERNLLHNMRGVHVEGDFFKTFSFATTFYENQARFSPYETNYYMSVGEQYPTSDTTYSTQNAVIPGAGRTKPFKDDGFDFAYATGYFVYSPVKTVRIAAGNNPQFIGDGHRSLLLSDNSYSAPYIRLDWNISDHFNFSYLRSRQINLLRRSVSSSAEVYYESKGYSVNYFTYKPTNKSSISLFEGSVWNRGNDTVSHFSHPLYFNPIPVLSGLILKDQDEVASLLGLNMNFQIAKKHRAYGQLAMNDFNTSKIAYQIGYRGYDFFGLNDFTLQLEYNGVPRGVYEVSNRRLNYSHYNLPVAHSKGSGFSELILRTNYEHKHLYAELSSVFYLTKDYVENGHLSVSDLEPGTDNTIFYQSVEVGYRFNRKMNLVTFISWRYRTTTEPMTQTANIIQAGFKTSLTNHYNDF
ncbi:MAG: hypothetical protein ACI837_000050 [Crocinitomicaceae bacterium]|jgi:hypothetical protein